MKDIMFFIGRAFCHQLEERSIHIDGMYLPLCARCTGIYIGIFIGYMYLFLKKRINNNKPISIKIILFMVMCYIPLMYDGVTSYLGLRESNNLMRLVTGIFMGYSIPGLVVLLYNFDNKNGIDKEIYNNIYELIKILLYANIFGLIVYYKFLNYYIVSFIIIITLVINLFLIIKLFIIQFNIFSKRVQNILSIGFTIGIIILLSNINMILKRTLL